MLFSASTRVLYTRSPPTMVVVLTVGFCSTMVHLLVVVSCTIQKSASAGVAKAATRMLATRSFAFIGFSFRTSDGGTTGSRDDLFLGRRGDSIALILRCAIHPP